ncbi:MAG: glycosyltransferase family 4 protein [Candidatus Hodarchaeota archaeon]
MHIVIDAHLAVKKIDGIARYLNGLLLELPKIDSSIKFTVLTLPTNKSSLSEDIFSHSNVNRVKLNLMGPSPKQHFITWRLLREVNGDVYHHPQYDLPLGVPVPSVITIHDLKYIFHAEYLRKRSRLKRFYIKSTLQRSLKVADQIIVVSQSTLNDLKQLNSFNWEKVSVIYHGVDSPLEIEDEKINEIIKDFDISENFILFVGTRRPHKNIGGLIRALGILRKRYGLDIDLVMSGKAYSDYREPEKISNELDLDSYTHFLDFIPDSKLPALYQSAKVVALVSYYEGFGLPLLEAMSYGTPVIGSNVSSIPEVIGNAGLLADPYNPEDIAKKIYQIITDSHLAAKLSQAGLERSKQFSWRSLAESTLNIYIKAFLAK